MKKLSIRPVLAFIARQNRNYLTAGDWRQLHAKIDKQRVQKEARGEGVIKEQEYLRIIEHVSALFRAENKIKTTKIIQTIDRYLRKENYGYQEEIHETQTKSNIFYYAEQKRGAVSSYDVAFYNHLASTSRPAHHVSAKNDFRSVYFMRCEESAEQILIGNLQIDDTMPQYWDDPVVGQIMLQTKNMTSMMVQHALRHALRTGKKDILFQCGDANDLTQWGRQSLREVRVTRRNYKKFMEDYEVRRKKFDSPEVRPGEILPKAKENNYRYQCVLAAGPDYYQTHEQEVHIPLLLNLIMFFYADDNILATGEFDNKVSKLVLEAEHDIENALCGDQPGQALKLINRLIFKITGTRPPRTDRAEKIKMLTRFPKPAHEDDVQRIIDDFIQHWEYDKIILAHYPAIKRFNLSPAQPGERPRAYYYNQNDKANLRTYRRHQLKIPQIGKTYFTPPKDRYNINFALSGNPVGVPYYKIYQWYEKRLPEEFRHHKLKYEKVPITTVQGGRPRKAHAWKIIDGITEFKKRPLAVFATGTELKMDCETLPRLQMAATKFGGPPQQLKIINDLIMFQGESRLGKYYESADKIVLANRSLAILAHEGLHRLRAKELIPEKEYRALVAAGAQLASQNPAIAQYINQRDKQNQLCYPQGPARTEELAAIFVETYYATNAGARKNLMGRKIPLVSKVLNYIHTVVDILLGEFGHVPSQARSFLRRVEQGAFVGPQQSKNYQLKPRLDEYAPIR